MNAPEQDALRLIEAGHALEAQGRLEEAKQRYLEAIRAAPTLARAHLNLGNVLLAAGDLPGALDAFKTALKHQPDYAGAYYNIGNALLGSGQLDAALASYRKALALKPDYAEVHCALGVAVQNQGRMEDAVACFRRALEFDPDFVEAHFNLGMSLQSLGRLEDALASYRRTLELKPDFAEAHRALGIALKDLWRYEEAEACYRRALEIKPDLAEAHSNLCVALREQGRLAEAEINCRRALDIQPDNAGFRVAHTFTLPIAPQTVTDSLAVPVMFDRALQELSAWVFSAPENQRSFYDAVGAHQPFYLAYRNGNHIKLLSRYGDLLAIPLQASTTPIPQRRKLRLAVVSDHFRRHSVWDVILHGILTNLDRSRFEMVLYNLSRVEDEETRFARSLCDVWRDFHTVHGFNGWLDEMAADQPDVIFYPEIGMDPMTCRLATRRLAPLQVAGWGHPITTGLPTIDLYFSGELIEGPEADTHYRERLVRLPGTGCCTAPIETLPQALPELADALAKRDGVRFLIAQMPFKFDPENDALFAGIAAVVGKSTFILLDNPQFSWSTEQLIDRLNREFRKRNLDPKQHLYVVPWLSREKFYSLLDMCDIYLDCPSFSGYTTAWQAVHRGLPVITLEGKFMRQRLAAGLLRKIGMTDTIAASTDDYISIAARLAVECRDPVRRDARRDKLKAAAPLADHDIRVVREFEQSLIDELAKRGRHFEADFAG